MRKQWCGIWVEEDWSLVLIGASFVGSIPAAIALWWGGLSAAKQAALFLLLGAIIEEGARWIYRKLTEDDYERVEWEDGYFVLNKETGEIVEGEKMENGFHKVWVHIPGEGDLGGHWEDDLDNDGVAASVDDDDNDPGVGDEDPNKP